MPENTRWIEQIVLNLLQIQCGRHRRLPHADENLARPDRGGVNVIDGYYAGPAINGGTHVIWNREQSYQKFALGQVLSQPFGSLGSAPLQPHEFAKTFHRVHESEHS